MIFGEVLACSGTLKLKQKLLWLFLHAGHHLPIELAWFVWQVDQNLPLCVASRYVVFMFLAPVEMAVQ